MCTNWNKWKIAIFHRRYWSFEVALLFVRLCFILMMETKPRFKFSNLNRRLVNYPQNAIKCLFLSRIAMKSYTIAFLDTNYSFLLSFMCIKRFLIWTNRSVEKKTILTTLSHVPDNLCEITIHPNAHPKISM